MRRQSCRGAQREREAWQSNGFGRIGRNYLPTALAQWQGDLENRRVNGPHGQCGPLATLAQSTTPWVDPLCHRRVLTWRLDHRRRAPHSGLSRAYRLRPPVGYLGVDIVNRGSTGRFTQGTRRRQKAHRRRQPKVGCSFSDPASRNDANGASMGVNEEDNNPDSDVIISNASCTTNLPRAAAPKVFQPTPFGIERGLNDDGLDAYDRGQGNLQESGRTATAGRRRGRGGPPSTCVARLHGRGQAPMAVACSRSRAWPASSSGSPTAVPVLPTRGSTLISRVVTPTEGVTVRTD